MDAQRHGERTRRSLRRLLEEKSDLSRRVYANVTHVGMERPTNLFCALSPDGASCKTRPERSPVAIPVLVPAGSGTCVPSRRLRALIVPHEPDTLNLVLDPSTPCANRGISATVRVQHGKRIGRPRLAVNRHHDAAPARQHVKNPPVVRLKPTRRIVPAIPVFVRP